MVMVWHRAIIPTFQRELLDDIREQIEEVDVIGIVEEDLHATVPSGHDVAEEAG
jgi:hypothetical protein